jgi:hypothetical protein
MKGRTEIRRITPTYSLGETLTEEQTELLDKDIKEFTEAEYESQEQIVKDNLIVFKNT